MNEAVAKDLSAALRSGKYKKGMRYLRVNDCFCVLGVLCDLLRPKGWRTNPLTGSVGLLGVMEMRGKHIETGLEVWRHDFVPYDLMQKAGLSHSGQAQLTALNDERGHSFEEIATYIDNNWRNL